MILFTHEKETIKQLKPMNMKMREPSSLIYGKNNMKKEITKI